MAILRGSAPRVRNAAAHRRAIETPHSIRRRKREQILLKKSVS
jgi:hypothetical protein